MMDKRLDFADCEPTWANPLDAINYYRRENLKQADEIEALRREVIILKRAHDDAVEQLVLARSGLGRYQEREATNGWAQL